MHRIRATLRHALNVAIKQDRLIDFNPAAVVELPAATRPKGLVWTEERVARWRADQRRQPGRRRRAPCRAQRGRDPGLPPRPSPVMVWTPEQTSAFLAYARRHRLYALYRLIALRGLRRGEAVGLRWPEVSFTAATIAVNWQITQLGWTPVQGKPKTDASERVIALDAETLSILKEHRRRQAKERLQAGEGWADSGFVFTDEYGRPLHPQHVTDQFYWMCYEADLPPLRLHDLRHGAASLMLAAGVELKIVQETDPRPRLEHLHPRHLHQRLPRSRTRGGRIHGRSAGCPQLNAVSGWAEQSPQRQEGDLPCRRKTPTGSRSQLAIVPDV